MQKRVVVTGLGVVSSLGIGVDGFWQSIKSGKCGISTVERVDVSDMPTKVGAEIKDFNPGDFIDKKEAKRMDKFSQYAVVAAQLAVEHAKLDLNKVNNERMGVIIGTGIGGIETLETQYMFDGEGPGE